MSNLVLLQSVVLSLVIHTAERDSRTGEGGHCTGQGTGSESETETRVSVIYSKSLFKQSECFCLYNCSASNSWYMILKDRLEVSQWNRSIHFPEWETWHQQLFHCIMLLISKGQWTTNEHYTHQPLSTSWGFIHNPLLEYVGGFMGLDKFAVEECLELSCVSLHTLVVG